MGASFATSSVRAPRQPVAVRWIGHFLIAILAVSGLETLGPHHVRSRLETAPNLQLARDNRVSSDIDDDDADLSTDKGRTKVPRLPGEKSPRGGYDSQRIHGFWRHYHGAPPPARKAKPIDHEK